jgi:hypothetical protein
LSSDTPIKFGKRHDTPATIDGETNNCRLLFSITADINSLLLEKLPTILFDNDNDNVF